MVYMVLVYASVLWEMKRHTVPKKWAHNFCGLIISHEELKKPTLFHEKEVTV